MKRKLLLIMIDLHNFIIKKVKWFFPVLISFLLAIQTIYADGGVGYKGIYINNNGTKTWYKAHNVAWSYNGCGNYQFISASDFSGQDFGSLTSSQTLQISGFAVVGWTNSSDWVAGKLLYKVWKQGDSEPGTWSEIYIGNYGNGNGATEVVCSNSNDRVVGYDNGTTNLNPGAPGTYNFKIQALGRMQWSGGSFNVNDGTEVTATFTITSSATDQFRSKATGNWNTAGTWESSSNGTNWATSTLVPGNTASSITIQNSHNITLDGNVSVAGLTINSGATFTASDATPRTLTFSKSASGSTTTLANNGTWVNGDGGSTVVFTGAPSSGDATQAVTGTIAFQNITVNKTGGSSNVGASFGANSSLSGTLEIGTGGFISTAPPTNFYSPNAILKFNQGAIATYNVNPSDKTWSTTEVPNNITIQSGTVNINENRTASGNLLINADAKLNLSAGKQLTVNSTLTNNGTLTLKSTDTDGTASIITTGTVTGGGTTEVEQYITSVATGVTGRNWYISSPLSAASVSTITTETGNNLVYWNGSAWANASGTMDVMKGYIAKSPNGNKTIKFTGGLLNTGDQSVSNLPLGFNLVGNPYASWVDFSEATKTNVTGSIWYRNKSTGAYLFHTYNVNGGIGVNDATEIIPPMQSFWIKTTNATNTFGFTNIMRSHETGNRLKAPEVSTKKLLRLEIENGIENDETVVYFNQNALDTFDEYDSEKMFNDQTSSPEIFTTAGNEQLVINGMNNYYPGLELPLGFNAGQINNYSIRASQLLNLADVKVVLKDKLTTTEFDLTNGDAYQFTSNETSGVDRFSVLFKSASGTTGYCCDIVNAGMFAYSNNGRILLTCNNSISENTSVTVYNGLGQLVHIQQINSLSTTLNKNFENGMYLLKVENESGSVVLRTLVR